MITIDH